MNSRFKALTMIVIAIILVLSTALSAGAAGTATEPPSPYKAFDMKGVTITFSKWWNEVPEEGTQDREKWDANKQRIEKKYNVKLEFVNVGYGEEVKKLVTSSLAGKAYADVIRTELWNMPQLAQQGLIADLTKFDNFNDEKRWSAWVRNDGKWAGKQYGVYPATSIARTLWYNKSMIERLNMPDPYELYKKGQWNWDNFKKIAKAATKDTNGDGKTDIFGLAAAGNEITNYILASNGAAAVKFNKQGKPGYGLDTPEAMKALNFMYDIFNVDKIATADDRTNKFKNGQAAFVLTDFWDVGNFAEMDDEYVMLFFPKGPDAKDYGVSTPFANLDFIAAKSGKDPQKVFQIYKDWYYRTLDPTPEQREQRAKDRHDALLAEYGSEITAEIYPEVTKRGRYEYSFSYGVDVGKIGDGIIKDKKKPAALVAAIKQESVSNIVKNFYGEKKK